MADYQIIETSLHSIPYLHYPSHPLQPREMLVRKLLNCNFQHIEIGSLGLNAQTPQSQDTLKLINNLPQESMHTLEVQVHNKQGLESLWEMAIKKIVFSTSAPNSCGPNNQTCMLSMTPEQIAEITALAKQHNKETRCYLLCTWQSPWEGKIATEKVEQKVDALFDMGVDKISLTDTTSDATPGEVILLLESLLKKHPPERFSVHFRDRNKMALANAIAALSMGITFFDTSLLNVPWCGSASHSISELSTETWLNYLTNQSMDINIDTIEVSEINAWLQTTIQQPSEKEPA